MTADASAAASDATVDPAPRTDPRTAWTPRQVGLVVLVLAVAAALNRIGVITVLLRPDGDLPREAELGGITRVVADPEHAHAARSLGPVHTFVLGGGGQPR